MINDKENVDDMRESPTQQLLESQERHLATGLKVYDPFITKDVVKNQYYDLDAFLADVDMVVVMVKHTEIRENVDKLVARLFLIATILLICRVCITSRI